MKLLQKTSRFYFVVSAFLLLVTGMLLYFFITDIIEEETKEQLLANEKRIAFRLSHNQPTTQLAPVIEIRKLTRFERETIIVIDTMLFDEIEQEHERFLQISSIRNVHGESYQIVLRQMMEEPIGYIRSIGLALAITFLFLLIASTYINRRVFRNIWQPFYRSLAALNSFSINQQKPIELKDSGIIEFRTLNEAIFKLTEKSRSDYNILKEFTENASHEMQTPVAVIQTKLEELLQSQGLTEVQAAQIKIASNAVHKLGKLNNVLILLTKIDNKQFQNSSFVSIGKIVKEQIKQFEDFIQAKELQIAIEIKNDIKLLADPILVEMLVSNLLSNAIKHNLIHGSINITLDGNIITFANTGHSLAIKPENLFERFTKVDKTSSSLGLGLAIVSSICSQYTWDISYEIKDDQHVIKVNLMSIDS